MLVPGDIVFLEAGNFIPADVRLIEAVNLRVEEAALTGKSVPVQKNAALRMEKDAPWATARTPPSWAPSSPTAAGVGWWSVPGCAPSLA